MVLLFFCVSGVLGEIRRHPSVTTRDEEPDEIRTLEADARLLAQTIEPFAGTLVVVGNDWPLVYDLDFLRQECLGLGRRIVNSVKALGGPKEDSVLTFMDTRPDPYVIVASSDFEFSELTAARRVDVNHWSGFDNESADRLRALLRECGGAATEAPSNDDVLRATVGTRELRRAQRYIDPLRAANDSKFKRHLAAILSDGKGE